MQKKTRFFMTRIEGNASLDRIWWIGQPGKRPWIRQFRFFPKPAEFKEILCGKIQNIATEKWLEVLGTVKRVGNYQSVKFSDPSIHSVINAMGGWQQICMMESKDEKWKQKEFERLYEIISNRGGDHPEYLIGKHEQDNFNRGIKYQQPIIKIGFQQKQKLLK